MIREKLILGNSKIKYFSLNMHHYELKFQFLHCTLYYFLIFELPEPSVDKLKVCLIRQLNSSTIQRKMLKIVLLKIFV